MPGRYAWTRDLSTGEAETVLRGWLRGELPPLDGWTRMERSGRTWRPLDGTDKAHFPLPQPHPDWPWVIKKETGSSFVDLLTKKRIETARELVLGSSMKMREIAERCGYSDQHYFSYCFKKYCGVSPNAMRQEKE